ncbi:hypothetical protein JL101_026785 [Skermanella rosea]|uniref:hypothetical protein n=1 Tax=Skermanella rosea TaxID=1817965 RepID=UPI001932C7F0|nr:hypothetical protein [Skermanella rosea]UEM03516.1 hypothetical protein JL101_026785 [Skermanella rosea]
MLRKLAGAVRRSHDGRHPVYINENTHQKRSAGVCFDDNTLRDHTSDLDNPRLAIPAKA